MWGLDRAGGSEKENPGDPQRGDCTQTAEDSRNRWAYQMEGGQSHQIHHPRHTDASRVSVFPPLVYVDIESSFFLSTDRLSRSGLSMPWPNRWATLKYMIKCWHRSTSSVGLPSILSLCETCSLPSKILVRTLSPFFFRFFWYTN